MRLTGLPAASWKWRQRLAAWPLGRRIAASATAPQALVATDLVDLAHLRVASRLPDSVPFLLYMHENQLTYPRPPGEPLERSFAVSHVASTLAADSIAFNSRVHKDAMIDAMTGFLAEVPPPKPRGLLGRLGRARVLPPGVDLDAFPSPAGRACGRPPVIAWNHRWEEDKRPSAFAGILIALADAGADFRLVLLGTGDQVVPKPLLEIRERLGGRVLRDGPARSRGEYAAWLARSDLVVSTAVQENFGYAVIEAMAAGCVPLLPRRLSYPEILPPALAAELLYDSDRSLRERLAAWLADPSRIEARRVPVMRAAERHGWARRIDPLDSWVDDVTERAAGERA